MRINCPNCGSTAQIELVWEERSNYDTKKIKEYECGCGCHFETTFTLTDIKILEEF